MDYFKNIFQANKDAGLYKEFDYLKNNNCDNEFPFKIIRELRAETNDFSLCGPIFNFNFIPQTLHIVGIEILYCFQAVLYGNKLLIGVCVRRTAMGRFDRHTINKLINLSNPSNEDIDDLIKICNAYKLYNTISRGRARDNKFNKNAKYDLSILLTIFPEVQTIVDNYKRTEINNYYRRAYNDYESFYNNNKVLIVNKITIRFLDASIAKFYNIFPSEKDDYGDVKNMIDTIKELESKRTNTPIDVSNTLTINGISIDCSILDVACVNKIIAVLHS